MIVDLDEVSKIGQESLNKKIGLITGCFDILHLGHINLFEFAKSHVDTLIVGIDSDKSVKINKGDTRPYFDQNTRAKVIDSIKFIDYTFLIDHQLKYSDPAINRFFMDLYANIGITHLITNRQADSSYPHKEKHARSLAIKFVLQEADKFSSSSIIRDLGL